MAVDSVSHERLLEANARIADEPWKRNGTRFRFDPRHFRENPTTCLLFSFARSSRQIPSTSIDSCDWRRRSYRSAQLTLGKTIIQSSLKKSYSICDHLLKVSSFTHIIYTRAHTHTQTNKKRAGFPLLSFQSYTIIIILKKITKNIYYIQKLGEKETKIRKCVCGPRLSCPTPPCLKTIPKKR